MNFKEWHLVPCVPRKTQAGAQGCVHQRFDDAAPGQNAVLLGLCKQDTRDADYCNRDNAQHRAVPNLEKQAFMAFRQHLSIVVLRGARES